MQIPSRTNAKLVLWLSKTCLIREIGSSTTTEKLPLHPTRREGTERAGDNIRWQPVRDVHVLEEMSW